MGRPGIVLYFDMLEPIRVLSDSEKGRLLVAMLEYGQTGAEPEVEGMLALAWGFVKAKLDRDAGNYRIAVLKRQYGTFCRERKKRGQSKMSYEAWMQTVEKRKDESLSLIINDDESYLTITETETISETETETETVSEAVAAAETETPCAAAAAKSSFQEMNRLSPGASPSVREAKDGANLGKWNVTERGEESGTNTDQFGHELAAGASRLSAGASPGSAVKAVGGELGRHVVFLSEAQIEDLLERMELETFDYYVSKLAAFIQKNGAKVKNHYETILRWYREDGAVRR